MKRVLIVHPHLTPSGGGNAVAAWALEALRQEFRVSLATLDPLNFHGINRSFGTSLSKGDFETLLAPVHFDLLLRVVKNPGALLDCQLTVRFAQNLDRQRRFDILLSTHNEVDFGRRGIQYVNLPGAYLPRGNEIPKLSHRIPGLHRTFRALCYGLGRTSSEGFRRNLFIANSHNIARQIRNVYDADSVVLYPPVPGSFPQVPFEERRAGFVAVGRITPLKRWHLAVEIVDGLRLRGHQLSLTLIGHREDPAYEAQLRALAGTRPWFRILPDLNRDELAGEITLHRYGLHTMHDEHFGIAPAEMLAADCLPFVHNSGGPIEIVGDPNLTFDTVGDAIEKIATVLETPRLEECLRRHAAKRKLQFTSEVFCSGLREIVRNFR